MMIMTAISVHSSPLSLADRRSLPVVEIVETTEVFIGVAIYLSIVIVGVTMNLAMARQLRDIALLRAIGASPGQIRRSVALQAVIVAAPSTIAGIVLAVPAGALWVAALKAHDVIPGAVQFKPQWQALPIALGIELATSLIGTTIAAMRTSRIPPATALTETATGRRRVTPVRTTAGLGLIVAGIVLSAILAQFSPENASV